MPSPKPLPAVQAAAPHSTVLEPEAAAAPEAPPELEMFNAPAESETPTQAPEQAKPQKTGNRFIRVLGKLNPFRKGAKNDSANPANAVANKD
jgi:hypothetical protein